jgi:hypothetical protein
MATYKKIFGRYCRGLSTMVLTALIVSFSVSADAGLLPADTVNAMPGWFGTEIIQFDESNGKNVDGSVDYAVYAPGQFNLSFPNQDPSNGTQYVYRYQLHNNPTPDSTDFIRKLTVGLVGITDSTGWHCTYIEPGSIYPSGGAAPTLQVQLTGTPYTSAVWAFKASAPVNTDSYSKMLIFTSPYSPTHQLATVLSSSSTDKWEGLLPSPVPEPATLIGMLSFGVLFLIQRVLRRK